MTPPVSRALEKRWVLALVSLLLTVGLGLAAASVKPDYSIEHFFPTFDQSRVDYERFKQDFPFEDAHAFVIVDAPDLFTRAGLRRIEALERDLGKVAGVTDTLGPSSVLDLVDDAEGLRMEKVFGGDEPTDAQIAHGKERLLGDPMFRGAMIANDGRAVNIVVTLTREVASQDATRVEFFHAAREVVEKHEALAKAQGVAQRLTLNGLPVIRSEFTEMIGRDLGQLFPVALAVILVLLFVAFRRVGDVIAALITILLSIVWSVGAMGLLSIPLQVLTQITPIVVMIVSISDTVHVVAHAREYQADGMAWRDAIVRSARENALPCLLTEITIAGGFLALAANDMVMIQQFGIATAAAMLLTWLANFTVLPLCLAFSSQKPDTRRARAHAGTLTARFVTWVEVVVTQKPRRVVMITALLAVGLAFAGTRVGREYYAYDDLRPEAALHQDLRYVESVIGGSVPMAIFVEPKQKSEDAMLDPTALALIDDVTTLLERDYAEDVHNAASLSKVLKKAHGVLAGEEQAATQPLPDTRALAAQELLTISDGRLLRDVVAFDGSTSAIYALMPDRGSSHATQVLERLRKDLDRLQQDTGYTLTITGIYGIADGIYRSMVGGLAVSLGLAVLVSFAIFCGVLRSWRLALIALVPNLLPLLVTLGMMSLLGIDIKPTTVTVFSITLVIADDDTIQFLTRFRARFLELGAVSDRHARAALDTLRRSGGPMLVTTLAVTIGFLALMRSEFLGLANLGLLIGVSLFAAVLADLFLTPIMLMRLRPKLV
jgi:predicted RND superfamily exporter protein